MTCGIQQQETSKRNPGGIPRGLDTLISTGVCAEKQQPSADDFSFAVYKRALQLEFRLMEYSLMVHGVPDGYYNLLLCGVLQYNIGLAHLLAAFETGNSEHLVKAINCYERATRALEVDHLLWGENGQAISERSNLAFLAIANNLGQAFSFFRNFESTNTCSTDMICRLAFAMSAPTSGSSSRSPMHLALFSEQFKDFLLNASFFSMIEVLPTPSA
jgi:hypothetical protein